MILKGQLVSDNPSRTEKRQQQKKRNQRTDQYETAVKTQNLSNQLNRLLDKDLEDLQQKRFDSLVRQGIIVPEDMSHIFDPMNGINWI